MVNGEESVGLAAMSRQDQRGELPLPWIKDLPTGICSNWTSTSLFPAAVPSVSDICPQGSYPSVSGISLISALISLHPAHHRNFCHLPLLTVLLCLQPAASSVKSQGCSTLYQRLDQYLKLQNQGSTKMAWSQFSSPPLSSLTSCSSKSSPEAGFLIVKWHKHENAWHHLAFKVLQGWTWGARPPQRENS